MVQLNLSIPNLAIKRFGLWALEVLMSGHVTLPIAQHLKSKVPTQMPTAVMVSNSINWIMLVASQIW